MRHKHFGARSTVTVLLSYQATSTKGLAHQAPMWLCYVAQKPRWTATYIYKQLKTLYSLSSDLHNRGPDATCAYACVPMPC